MVTNWKQDYYKTIYKNNRIHRQTLFKYQDGLMVVAISRCSIFFGGRVWHEIIINFSNFKEIVFGRFLL